MAIQFTKGKFYTFRAVKRVHLGSIEVNIDIDDTFEFDGQTLRIGGADHVVPNLKSGIQAGWFVPEGDVPTTESTKSVAAPARKVVKTVDDDERQVGFATNDARNRASSTPKNEKVVENEGVAIGKVRTAAQQRVVVSDPAAADREINRLDQMQGVRVKPIATGDVQQSMAGDELEDILPEAKSTGRPPPTKNNDAIARAEQAKQARLAAVNAAKQSPPDETGDDVDALLNDLADPDPVSDAVDRMAALAPEGFEWDMALPTEGRVAAALAKRDDRAFLTTVLAFETATVRNGIISGLRG